MFVRFVLFILFIVLLSLLLSQYLYRNLYAKPETIEILSVSPKLRTELSTEQLVFHLSDANSSNVLAVSC